MQQSNADGQLGKAAIFKSKLQPIQDKCVKYKYRPHYLHTIRTQHCKSAHFYNIHLP